MTLFDFFNSDDQPSSNCNLSQDEVHEILTNARRREAIKIISTVGRITVGRLADEVSDVDNANRQSVYVALYQNHLAVLEKYEVIQYNQDRGVVEPARNIDVLNTLMQDVESRLS